MSGRGGHSYRGRGRRGRGRGGRDDRNRDQEPEQFTLPARLGDYVVDYSAIGNPVQFTSGARPPSGVVAADTISAFQNLQLADDPSGSRQSNIISNRSSSQHDLQYRPGPDSDTNSQFPRYEDGEVRRYGAGESYRPYNRDRSPRSGRSPPPRPMRSPVREIREVRERGRTPPGASDSYVPGRSPPRRRSRSLDRFRRRERSREPETWRRRDRSRSRPRSPIRRNSPPPPPLRRSPMPRRSPPPRFVSPRRDDRNDRRDDRRDDRDERPRSLPRRNNFDPRDIMRPRTRSPFDRDRPRRNRSPLRRSPPATAQRGGSYRPRSRSIERREREDRDRYPGPPFRRPSPPPRDSVNSSAITSRSASGRSSPRPSSRRGRDDRSRHQSPNRSPFVAPPSAPTPIPAFERREREAENVRHTPDSTASREIRDTRESYESRETRQIREPPKQPAQDITPVPPRSPPKGPAALRAPPTGPAAGRNFTSPAPQHAQPYRQAQTPTGPSRPDITSPTIPPAGPRGYVPPRGGGGGFAPRGGRGGWPNIPPRHNMPGPSVSPTIPPTGPSGNIPTGPRAGGNHPSPSTTSSPSINSKPFNPPTGPASQHHNNIPPQRQTLAQSLMASMPPLIPGGKIDPATTHITLGVTKELEPHFRKLLEEEERLREELRIKEEKLRKNLQIWDKMEREAKSFQLKSDLSEQSLQALCGEPSGGASF